MNVFYCLFVDTETMTASIKMMFLCFADNPQCWSSLRLEKRHKYRAFWCESEYCRKGSVAVQQPMSSARWRAASYLRRSEYLPSEWRHLSLRSCAVMSGGPRSACIRVICCPGDCREAAVSLNNFLSFPRNLLGHATLKHLYKPEIIAAVQ